MAALPAGFEDLARFVPGWALPAEYDRHEKRLALSIEEVRAFYDALFPRMEAVMAHLQRLPADALESLGEDERNLFYLAMGFMEMSHPVDLGWKGVDIEDSYPIRRIDFLPPSNQPG